jgi:hypothetical protein
MAQMKRVPAKQLKKAAEKMQSNPKPKITGSASSTIRVSSSMIKSQPKVVSKPKAPAISRTVTSTPSARPKTTAPKKPTGTRARRVIGGM